MASYPRKIPDPPSSLTDPLRRYLQQVADYVNGMPTFSLFSGTSPNSTVTGTPGNFAVNIGSASTQSRVWVMGGSTSAATNQGWVALRILA